MMVASALVIGAQVAAPAAALRRETVESVTQPIEVIECRLIDSAMRPANLLLESRGARGFSRDGQVRASRAELVVIADSGSALRGAAKLYDNPLNQSYSGLWNDRTLSAETSRSGTFVAARFQQALGERFRIEVEVTSPPLGSAAAAISHSGFCGVSRWAQRPLTDDETERLASQ